MIDLSSYFATLDDVVAATTQQQDGSILIDLSAGSGSGNVQVLNTTIADLSATNVNVVCFAAGTLILTPDGEKPIEDLKVDDQVVTYSGISKTLMAINIRRLGKQELHDRPNLWPVAIAKGALGEGVPREELRVSPQHRVLVNSKIVHRMVGGPALVAAKKLLQLPGVDRPRPKEGCTYIHLLFDEHKVVRANGCWSESFYPGDQALQALPHPMAKEYQAIFGNMSEPSSPIIEGKKASHMIYRHKRNHKPIQKALSQTFSLPE